MSLSTRIKRSAIEFAYDSPVTKKAYHTYQAAWAGIMARYPVGTNVYDRNWDALILLDTCRVDALQEVAPEYSFLDENRIGSLRSIGSTSMEWIANTFTAERIDEIQQTAYVTSNAFAEHVLINREYPYPGFTHSRLLGWNPASPDDFSLLDQPWKYIPDDQKPFAHTPAHYITDRAIAANRNYDIDRLIVHYSQPHDPYTAAALEEDRELEPYEESPFDYLRDGGSPRKVWNAYLTDLRDVLTEVEELLENLSAKRVVISADHGELFGELGLYHHPMGVLHPVVRRVPWAVTSASDENTRQPRLERPSDENRVAEDQLEALGYL